MNAQATRTGKPQSKAPLSLIALQIVRESLVPEASLPELARLAASDAGFALRIIAVVNSPAFGPQRHVSDVRQAFGVASVCGPGCAGTMKDLIARADAALYAAKHSGRNRVMTAEA